MTEKYTAQELTELIARAKEQRARARKMGLRDVVTNCNNVLFDLTDRLARITK